jgi:hypothetical protein
MLSRRARTLLLTFGLLGAVVPAIAQNPQSLLPPGFGDPKSQPPPATPKAPPPAPTPPSATPTPPPPPPGIVVSPGDPTAQSARPQQAEDSALTDLEALPAQPAPRFYDLPPGAQRPTDVVGVIGPDNRGLQIDAFGGAEGDGVYLATMMHELQVPLPSRWASILLRRALTSRVFAPARFDPVDFVAERVRLLVRMGDADGARLLAQSVDIDSYTRNMVVAAYEASLASADPAGLCPLVQKGRAAFDDPVWPMADAMCAALEGEAARATTLIEQARRGGARGADLLLAEKIVGAGSDTRGSVAVQWDAVPELNIWRFGLASAAGDPVPDRLLAIAGPAMQAWLARAPMIRIEQRVAAADTAAVLGIFSSASLVDVQALAMEASDARDQSDTVPGRLQTAYAGGDAGARMGALRALWREGADDAGKHYARLILTAGAAAAVAPSDDYAADAGNIVGALLSAGMDREAAAWANVAENGSGTDLAAVLLAIGAPRPPAVDTGRIEALGGAKKRFAAAALAGLGRLDANAARGLGVDIGRENAWTRALDQAASSGQQGTVALLAAVGLQTPDWGSVPPDHLFRIVRALRQVGLEYQARMIGAEAVTRA